MSASQPSAHYMPQLDGLRALAVVCVFVEHWSPRPPMLPVQLGILGVQLFFVLSGFLITSILLRARASIESRETQDPSGRHQAMRHALKAFYARRFLRIFPLYYAIVVLCLLIQVPQVRGLVFWFLTYTVNIPIALSGNWPAMGHLWTLAVEEQFYLFWPLLVLLAPRRWFLPVCVGLILLAPVVRIVHHVLIPDDVHGLLLVANTDALCLGALLAWMGPGTPRARRWARGALCVGGAAMVIAAWVRWATPGDPQAWKWVTRCAVVYVLVWVIWRGAVGYKPGWVGSLLSLKPVVYMGRISYGLYIFHGLAGFTWSRLGPGLGNLTGLSEIWWTDKLHRLPFLVVLTFGAAILSWHFFEKPLNALKRHFPYMPATARKATP